MKDAWAREVQGPITLLDLFMMIGQFTLATPLLHIFLPSILGESCPKNQTVKAVDCADVLLLGHNKSGIYEIWPMNRVTEGRQLFVYCDMDTDGGGWTVSII